MNLGVTKYTVNKVHALKKEQDVAESAELGAGLTLSEEPVQTLKLFCEDKFFQMCPQKAE
jgi:hypothetical protein